MNEDDLRLRTKEFALRIIKLADSLPKNASGKAIGTQIIRSGTSIGANYRAACRARSTNEFVSKLGIVLEESDETVFWIELIIESNLLSKEKMQSIHKEANELTAIFASSIKSCKNKVSNI